MKKILKLFIPVFMILFCFSVPACSANEDYSEYDFTYPYVIDDAEILNNDKELSDKLSKIGKKYDVDIVVVTVDSTDGKTATEFADDFYDYNDYSNDGILFLLTMDHKWAISTKGYGIKAFTDYGCDFIFSQMKPYLSDNDFEEAFNEFASQCDDFLKQAEKGKPYDTNNKCDTNNNAKESKNILYIVICACVTGIIGGLVVAFILKSQLKSVKFQKNASSYVNNGSVRITQSRDMFLYKTVSKTRRESDSSSNSGGGGGSSTHTSSSGSTHGGSSGSW